MHLLKKHRITDASPNPSDGPQEAQEDQEVQEAQEAQETQEAQEAGSETSAALKAQRRDSSSTPCNNTRRQEFLDLALGQIIDTNSDLGSLDDSFLRGLFGQLNPALSRDIELGRKAMREHLEMTFAASKDTVKLALKHALTKIHLFYGFWAIPNWNLHNFIGVTAHFLDRDGVPQQWLIALRQRLNDGLDDNITEDLRGIIGEWELENQIGCLVSDHASKNDIYTKDLYLGLNPAFGEQGALDRRLHCYGQIFNEVSRAILYGDDFEAFENASKRLDCGDISDDYLNHWRRRGPIGRLHNLVRWVRSSPQRGKLFKAIVREAGESDDDVLLASTSTLEWQLVCNDATRWKSTYLIIRQALANRDKIHDYLDLNNQDTDPDYVPKEDSLDDDDWLLLAELNNVLQPLYAMTLGIQDWVQSGRCDALCEILTAVEYLVQRMEHWKGVFDDPANEATQRTRRENVDAARCADLLERLEASSRAHLRDAVLIGWSRLNKYYEALSRSPLYAAAVILNPALGIYFLRTLWDEDRILTAQNKLSVYWNKWYRHRVTYWPGSAAEASTASSTPNKDFQKWLSDRIPGRSELDRYYKLPLSLLKEGDDDPIQWWLQKREEFPTLSQLALDLLAVPATSGECEKAFSAAEVTMLQQQGPMAPWTLEKFQCIRNWIHRRAITLAGVPYPDSETTTPSML